MTTDLSRRERKRAATRAAILAAARRLFGDKGYEATTIEDIARADDVAVQTVFNHVPSKEELFFADRVPWVAELKAPPVPRPGESWVDALVRQLVAVTLDYARSLEDAFELKMAAETEQNGGLARYERGLHAEAENVVTALVAEAGVTPTPRLMAAVLLAATRVHSLEHRDRLLAGVDVGDSLGRLESELTERLYAIAAAVTAPVVPDPPPGPPGD